MNGNRFLTLATVRKVIEGFNLFFIILDFHSSTLIKLRCAPFLPHNEHGNVLPWLRLEENWNVNFG